MVKSSNFLNFHLLSMRYISVKKGRGNYMLGCKFNSEVNSVQGSLGVQCLCYFLFQIIDAVAWSFLSCLKLRRLVYCKVPSSRPGYYSMLYLFGQRSQYISIKFALHKILKCATNRDSLLLATLRY